MRIFFLPQESLASLDHRLRMLREEIWRRRPSRGGRTPGTAPLRRARPPPPANTGPPAPAAPPVGQWCVLSELAPQPDAPDCMAVRVNLARCSSVLLNRLNMVLNRECRKVQIANAQKASWHGSRPGSASSST